MGWFSNLERYVSVFLPGATRPIVQEMIRRTLDNFLTRTEVWKETLTEVPFVTELFGVVQAGETVELRVDDTEIARWLSVKDAHTGNQIPFKTRTELDKIDSRWETRTGTSPLYFTVEDDPRDLRVYPYAETFEDARMTARVAITIGTAAGFPDFVFARYFNAIRDGTLAYVLAIPGKDWTDLRLAGEFLALYEDAVVKAKSEGNAEHGEPIREIQYGGL